MANLTGVNGTKKLTSEDFAPYDQAAAVICFILATAIVSLNVFVIYTLLFRTKKKSRLFFFIMHLAIADILVGLVCVLGEGIQNAMYGAWYGGDAFCRIWRYSTMVLLMASNNMLIGMSVDRYIAVRYPMKTIRTGYSVYLDKSLVIGAWLISLLAPAWIMGYTYGVNGTPDGGGGCFVSLQKQWMWELYVIGTGAVIVLLPLIVIAFCYTGISIVVWRKWKKGLQLSEINKDQSKALQGSNQANVGLLPKAKVKTIKMTFVICLVFLFCWLPYFLITLLRLYGHVMIDGRFYIVLSTLFPLNSACNPLVFICFNWKLFRRKQNGEAKNVTTLTTAHDDHITQETSA